VVRRLIVVRHAKATHKPGFADFGRPLTGRGRRDATAAGKWLEGRGFVPDLVLCSASLRTRQTWDALATALPAAAGTEVCYDSRLYGAGEEDALDLAGATPDDVTTLMIIGHNPTAQQVAATLTGRGDLEFPTCAIAVIGLGGWTRLRPGAGELDALWTPASAGA
jgi:phosphohistidine phosphatase